MLPSFDYVIDASALLSLVVQIIEGTRSKLLLNTEEPSERAAPNMGTSSLSLLQGSSRRSRQQISRIPHQVSRFNILQTLATRVKQAQQVRSTRIN